MFFFFSRKGNGFESKTENGPPLITAEQYASRSAILSSLVVAWSSVLSLSSGSCTNYKYAVLAVGGKSGKISFWRFRQPEYYTIEHGRVSVDAKLVGLLQAHDGWINAISWEILSTDPLKPQLLLVTGSSDGRYVSHGCRKTVSQFFVIICSLSSSIGLFEPNCFSDNYGSSNANLFYQKSK